MEIVATVLAKADTINASRIPRTAFESWNAAQFLTAIEIPSNDRTRDVSDEICARYNYLCDVGLGYYALIRATRT